MLKKIMTKSISNNLVYFHLLRCHIVTVACLAFPKISMHFLYYPTAKSLQFLQITLCPGTKSFSETKYVPWPFIPQIKIDFIGT